MASFGKNACVVGVALITMARGCLSFIVKTKEGVFYVFYTFPHALFPPWAGCRNGSVGVNRGPVCMITCLISGIIKSM